MSHLRIALINMAAFAGTAAAQGVTAAIRVVHDDPTGIIEPGQTVQWRVVATWQPQAQFAGIRFDVIATDNLGQAEDVWQYAAFGAPHVLGQPLGGSVVGTDIAIIPNFFTASPYPLSFQNTGLDLLRFDWTAPSLAVPTVIEFNLVREAIRPNARFYPSLNSPAWVEADTTWIGASVLVLPSPSSLGVLALAGAFTISRQRRRD